MSWCIHTFFLFDTWKKEMKHLYYFMPFFFSIIFIFDILYLFFKLIIRLFHTRYIVYWFTFIVLFQILTSKFHTCPSTSTSWMSMIWWWWSFMMFDFCKKKHNFYKITLNSNIKYHPLYDSFKIIPVRLIFFPSFFFLSVLTICASKYDLSIIILLFIRLSLLLG